MLGLCQRATEQRAGLCRFADRLPVIRRPGSLPISMSTHHTRYIHIHIIDMCFYMATNIICLYTYTCIHIYMYLHQSIYLSTYLHVRILLCLSVCVYICMHTYIHTCMHTYIHTYINIYIHIHIYLYVCASFCHPLSLHSMYRFHDNALEAPWSRMEDEVAKGGS